jgi:hypothetical protein
MGIGVDNYVHRAKKTNNQKLNTSGFIQILKKNE